VGKVALSFRTKDGDLLKTHYIASTSLAIAHVNNIVIRNFRRALAANGIVDDEIEIFGTFQARLYKLMGLEATVMQRQAWDLDVERRSKKSEKRKTVGYMSKRKQQRKSATEFRQGLRTGGHTYKGQDGKAASSSDDLGKGVIGACTCTASCQRGCPCKLAKQPCTGSCHPRSRGCKNLPGGMSNNGGASNAFDDAVPLHVCTNCLSSMWSSRAALCASNTTVMAGLRVRSLSIVSLWTVTMERRCSITSGLTTLPTGQR